mmetsp:Transcript_36985/g.92719  ORF Transcript_36985/g.92719 Transcript_36985/m.92719 type:complete len:160 (+) Transcript_36985:77-556(+)
MDETTTGGVEQVLEGVVRNALGDLPWWTPWALLVVIVLYFAVVHALLREWFTRWRQLRHAKAVDQQRAEEERRAIWERKQAEYNQAVAEARKTKQKQAPAKSKARKLPNFMTGYDDDDESKKGHHTSDYNPLSPSSTGYSRISSSMRRQGRSCGGGGCN